MPHVWFCFVGIAAEKGPGYVQAALQDDKGNEKPAIDPPVGVKLRQW